MSEVWRYQDGCLDVCEVCFVYSPARLMFELRPNPSKVWSVVDQSQPWTSLQSEMGDHCMTEIQRVW